MSLRESEMTTFYGMNGPKGRAKTLRSIRLNQEREARAAGVDPTDRAAFKAWKDAEFKALCARLTKGRQ
jgi:hypothetical protein